MVSKVMLPTVLTIILLGVFFSLPVYVKSTTETITYDVLEHPDKYNVSTNGLIDETSLEAIGHNVYVMTDPPIRTQLFQLMYFMYYSVVALVILKLWIPIESDYKPMLVKAREYIEDALEIQVLVFSIILFVIQRSII